jgi:hypothetical protein
LSRENLPALKIGFCFLKKVVIFDSFLHYYTFHPFIQLPPILDGQNPPANSDLACYQQPTICLLIAISEVGSLHAQLFVLQRNRIPTTIVGLAASAGGAPEYGCHREGYSIFVEIWELAKNHTTFNFNTSIQFTPIAQNIRTLSIVISTCQLDLDPNFPDFKRYGSANSVDYFRLLEVDGDHLIIGAA